jgi:CheY-like chemotaxis protein
MIRIILVGELQDVTILIVEDDDRVLELTADIIAGAGYKVARARNGVEALDVLAVAKGIALVLTDIWMPTMHGCALIEAIRSDNAVARVAILIMTDDVAPSHVPPGVRVLNKPFRDDALIEAVATELSKSKQQMRRSDAPPESATTSP